MPTQSLPTQVLSLQQGVGLVTGAGLQPSRGYIPPVLQPSSGFRTTTKRPAIYRTTTKKPAIYSRISTQSQASYTTGQYGDSDNQEKGNNKQFRHKYTQYNNNKHRHVNNQFSNPYNQPTTSHLASLARSKKWLQKHRQANRTRIIVNQLRGSEEVEEEVERQQETTPPPRLVTWVPSFKTKSRIQWLN